MPIIQEGTIQTRRDGVWQVRVSHDHPLLPRRVDGRWQRVPHYVLRMAPPVDPEAWETVARTTDETARWLTHGQSPGGCPRRCSPSSAA